MAFLNPLMLFGIAAVSAPIIIHLLNKRKFQRVTWAAMRFLKTSIEKNQRRMRIEDLLLLIVRCAMVALLAILLARPAIRAATASGLFGKAETAAVIIIDHSYSMSQTDGVTSRFDQARDAATQIIDSLPTGSSAAVLLASDAVKGLIPEPTFDLNLARKTIRDDARLSDRSTDLFPAIRQAMDILQRRPALRREIYLVTDDQRIGWRQLDAIRREMESAADKIQSNIVFVGSPEERNLGIGDLRLATGLPAMDQPLRFDAQVNNTGLVEASMVRVVLSMNDDPSPVDETTIDTIPAGESRSVSLFARMRSDGHHTVTAALSPDRVPADDRRTIAVRALTQVRVLLVDGDRGREARDSEIFFLRHALMPVPASEADGYFVQAASMSPLDLDSARFDDFDAVVLANVTDVSNRTLENIDAYLQRGGGLVVFPGNNTRAAFYNERMFEKHRWLPAAFGALQGDETNDEVFRRLQGKDFNHAIASVWRDPAAGSPAAARFYKSYELQPDTRGATDLAGEPLVILNYADGSPAVMERSWGQGRVIQFSSTADTAWNDLAVHPGIFVPLIRRSIGSIVQQQDDALNVPAGQKFIYRASPELLGRDAVISPPGGEEAAKDIRRIELLDRSAALQFEETGIGGAYRVEIGTDPATILKFAAQPDASESRLEPITQAQKESLAGAANVVDFTPGVSLEAVIEQQRVGTELWYPLAIMLLALAMAETCLAHWFSRSK